MTNIDNEFFGFDCYETVGSSETRCGCETEIKCFVYDMLTDIDDDDLEIYFKVHWYAECDYDDNFSHFSFDGCYDLEVPEKYKDNEHLKEFIKKIYNEISENGDIEVKERCEEDHMEYDYYLKF